MQTIGILGFGEVGKSLAKFYKNPKIKDLNRDDDLRGVEILHICIPYSAKFVNLVSKEIKAIRPRLVIINSTVAPQTTSKIAEKIPGILMVHSPVRGKHPHLYQGLKTYVKFVGADNKKAGQLAVKHFKSLGLKTKLLNSSLSTELAKLFCTTYYGVCIAWFKEMQEMCQKFGLDAAAVFADFNKTTNQGLKKIGLSGQHRPEIKMMAGPIGGHCVVPNAQILAKIFKSKSLDLVLKYARKKN